MYLYRTKRKRRWPSLRLRGLAGVHLEALALLTEYRYNESAEREVAHEQMIDNTNARSVAIALCSPCRR